MAESIQQVLDGEAGAECLTREQRRELDAHRAAIEMVTGPLRDVSPPDLTARVMSDIESIERSASPVSPSAGHRLATWLLAVQSFEVRWRPAYALAPVAVLLAVSPFWRGNVTPPTDAGFEVVAEPAPSEIFVQFRLEAPGARSVAVTGSFTNWVDNVDMIETIPGVWSAMLPLVPGVHDYTFIVDGQTWVLDPQAPAIDDGFGGSKNRLFLTLPVDNA